MRRGQAVRLSFFLELPFDLGFPRDATHTYFEADESIPGYEQHAFAPLPDVPAFPEPGLKTLTTFMFRRSRTRTASQFRATDKAFGRVIFGHLSAIGRLRRRISLLRAPDSIRGQETRTVVQLTRIDAFADEESWISDEFDAGLQKLNELLVVVASVVEDPSVGPLARADLPMAVPYLLGPVDDPEPELQSYFLLHWGPQGDAELLTQPQVDRLTAISARQHGQGHPFFQVAEALVETRRARLRGRYAQAVLESGTAFELMVSAVVREVGPWRGKDGNRVSGILYAGLKNILTEHFGSLVGSTVDLDDPTNVFGAWHGTAYELRNRVVHRGYRPTEREVDDCIAAVKEVIDHVSLSLAADPDTHDVGVMLAIPRPG